MTRSEKNTSSTNGESQAGAWFARIRNARLHLSRSEAQVADWVLEQPHVFVNSPIADIAKSAQVSQPTVIRFCRSVGCEGLQDLKLKLSGSLNGESSIQFNQVEQGDSIADISDKVLGNTASALLTLRQEVKPEVIGDAIAVLQAARRVDVFALGSSSSVADDAQYKLIRAGISAAARTDAYMMNLCAARLTVGDVALFISRSGKTPELIEAANLAAEQGATILALAPSNTPLAKKADVLIVINTDEQRQTKPAMLTRILQLALIDVLAVGLGQV